MTTFGRYALLGEIAAGGMATLHLARLTGPMGFSRIVAIKRLREAYAGDATFVTMLVDEARVGAYIQHPNVVATLDVVVRDREALLVLDYVHGPSLSRLLRRAQERSAPVPVPVAVSILAGTLRGLHAAHTARDAEGRPLEIVHRDLSPHNILVGVDGIARVADFGIAKARGRLSKTETGVLKGKAGYMAPEQIHGAASPRSDIFAMSVVAWEVLAGEKLFTGTTMNEILAGVIAGKIRRLDDVRADLPAAVAALVHKGLARDPEARPRSALEMAQDLERALRPASETEVGAWVRDLAGDSLESRDELLMVEAEATAVDPIESTELLTKTLRLPPIAPGTTTKRRAAVIGTSVALVGIVLAVARFGFSVGVRTSTAASSSPTPSVSDLPSEVPSAAGSAVVPLPSPSESAGAIGSAAPPHDVPPHRAQPRNAPSHCSPPFVIDTNGHVKYKRECLPR